MRKKDKLLEELFFETLFVSAPLFVVSILFTFVIILTEIWILFSIIAVIWLAWGGIFWMGYDYNKMLRSKYEKKN